MAKLCKSGYRSIASWQSETGITVEWAGGNSEGKMLFDRGVWLSWQI